MLCCRLQSTATRRPPRSWKSDSRGGVSEYCTMDSALNCNRITWDDIHLFRRVQHFQVIRSAVDSAHARPVVASFDCCNTVRSPDPETNTLFHSNFYNLQVGPHSVLPARGAAGARHQHRPAPGRRRPQPRLAQRLGVRPARQLRRFQLHGHHAEPRRR